MRRGRWWPLALWLAACDEPSPGGGTRDEDGDGYLVPYDCDDADPSRHPEASERCNGLDDNCDAEVDEDPIDGLPWYRDEDGDGYGQSDYPHDACYPDDDEVGTPGDCDDQDGGISPRADEECDGVDNDCDGATDEDSAVGAIPWFADEDGDGWGDGGTFWIACTAPVGFLSRARDCDDSDPDTRPGAREWCDGVDNDCDEVVDDSPADGLWGYPDDDGDGFGSPTGITWICPETEGYTVVGDDCDDVDSAVHPGATERCDEVDEDCDGTADEDAVDSSTWHLDADHDGQGEASGVHDRDACLAPRSYLADASDCDDGDASTYLGAVERCGTDADGDCDGSVAPCDLSRLAQGVAAADGLGAALAEAGDLDGDGRGDLGLGAPGAADGAGEVVLWLSAGSEGRWSGGDGEGAGGALVGGADLDADGLPDLLVGAPERSGAAAGAGAVYGLLDAAAGGDLSEADLIFAGDAADMSLGAALAARAGLDVAGLSGALVGAPGDQRGGAGAGAALLALGDRIGEVSASDADALLIGAAAGDGAGASVALWDIDADGTPDLVVGSPRSSSEAGRVAVVLGPVTGEVWLGDAELRLDGGAAADRAGAALLAPGDLDGDGAEDLLVGAPGATGDAATSGVVYLIGGSPTSGPLADAASARLVGARPWGRAGSALAVADLDGDGGADLAIGASQDDSDGLGAGTVWLVRGPLLGATSLADAAARVPGAAPGDQTGAALLAPGDVDGGGGSELVVGAPGDDAAGADAGAAILLTWPG